MTPSPNMSNEWELELNSMLANASNSFIINQRAVDDGKITWEAREQMFANILRNFREFLNSLLSSHRAEGFQEGVNKTKKADALLIEWARNEVEAEIKKVVEGMTRGACCDCKVEEGYKCYHAGREDVISDILSALEKIK